MVSQTQRKQHIVHAHLFRSQETVVAVIGPRLPSRQMLNDPSLLRRRYAQHVLSLFFPLNSPQNLVGVSQNRRMQDINDEVWWDRLIDLEQRNQLGVECKNYMKYCEDYYIVNKKGKLLANKDKRAFIERYIRESEINTPDITTVTENDADLIEYEGVD